MEGGVMAGALLLLASTPLHHDFLNVLVGRVNAPAIYVLDSKV
jgi:hypothetical protein